MAKRKMLTLDGFEDLLADISRANGSIDAAADKALKAGAAEIEKQLTAESAASDVPASVTKEIATEFSHDKNRFSVKVGWKLERYNPRELSQGFKALFLNYGTPHRSKHGQIAARGFITRAKKKSVKKVKAAQEEALKEILKGLE